MMPQEFTLQPSPRLRNARFISGDTISDSWLPEFSFQTPGDLSVVYATQTGTYIRIQDWVIAYFYLDFTPTYTTASGTALINNIPYGSGLISNVYAVIGTGEVAFSAGYTYGLMRTDTTLDNFVLLQAGHTTAGFALMTVTNIPSGTTFVNLAGQISYRIVNTK
jgi:hypothetical protein